LDHIEKQIKERPVKEIKLTLRKTRLNVGSRSRGNG